MTATDTHTETHVDEVDIPVTSGDGDGLYRLIASNDHKMVGRLWIGASIVLLLGLAILGVANDIERVDAGEASLFGSASRFFQSFVLFRTGIIFMVVVPLFIGLATAIVPLQVGSASIAFPRLAAAAFWGWLFASITHIISFLADGGLGDVSEVPRVRTDATQLTITSFGAMLIAILAASVCIATTIIALRPTGMTLLRVPSFSWSMLVATSVWLFSLPVLFANLIFSWVDLQGRPAIEFGTFDNIWARVEWAWSQPQIFAYAIPVLGIFGEIIPVVAKHRQSNRPVFLSLVGVFGVLSFGAWAQTFLSRGVSPAARAARDEIESAFLASEAGTAEHAQLAQRVLDLDDAIDSRFIYDEFLYVAFGLVILAVAGLALLGVFDTIRRGSLPKLSGAFLGATVGAFLLLDAVFVGAIRVIPFWDALHVDNQFLTSNTAILGLVVASSLAAALGGLSYWSPKIFGGYAAGPAAMGGAMAFLGGGLLLGLSNLVAAFDGQLDITISDTAGDIASTMGFLSIVGSALLVLGAISMLGAVAPALTSSEVLPDDPWEGHTLEWAAPSPPPVGNFVEPIETVRSSEPLLDEFEEVN